MHRYTIIGLLLCSILISIYVRIIDVNYELSSLVGTDSVRYVHQAKQIIEHGQMPDVDTFRASPVGKPTSVQLTLYSYVIAGVYYVAKLGHLDFEQFVVILPVLLFVLTIIPIYLLVWRIFGHGVALLSINILALTPPLVARTYAGFADRDGFILFLVIWCFFFYIQAHLKTDYKQWLYSGLLALSLLCLGLTWQGVGIFAAIMVTVELIKIIVDKSYNLRSAGRLALWVIPVLAGLLSFKPAIYSNLKQPYALVAIGYSGAVVFIALLLSIIQRIRFFNKLLSINHQLPLGFGVVCIFGIVSLLLLSDQLLNIFLSRLLAPFGNAPLFRVIAELQKLGLMGWTLWPGAFFMPMIVGLSFIVNDICDKLNLYKYWTLGSIQFIVFGIAFSRLVSGQSGANFVENSLTVGIYSSSVGIGIIGLLIGFIHTRFRGNSERDIPIDGLTYVKIFLVVWCVGMLISMRAAVRFAYLFTIPCTILGSYGLLQLFNRWFPENKRSWLYALGVICLPWQIYALLIYRAEQRWIIIFIFVLLVGITLLVIWCMTQAIIRRTLKRQFTVVGVVMYLIVLTSVSPHIALGGYASRIQSGLPVQLLTKDPAVEKSLTWIRENTDSNAVIAAHWEYGSWLNLLANRTTIVDEQQQWTAMMAKQVFVGNNGIPGALKFLRAHEVDYLFLTQRDIRHRGNICREAGVATNTSIPVFGNVVQRVAFVNEITGTSQDSYRYWLPNWQSAIGGYELVLKNKTYPADKWYISSIYLFVEESEEAMLPVKAMIELNLDGTVKYLSPQYLHYGEMVLHADERSTSFPCTILIHNDSNTDPTKWHIVYLSAGVRSLLMIRLFLLGELGEVFEHVYPTTNNPEDFAAQVWKIHYPNDIQMKPEYLK